MTMATTALFRWRRAEKLTVLQAARRFGIGALKYEELEAGKGECPASLALEIMTRTGGAVQASDLPGCATEPDASASSPGLLLVGASAGAGDEPAPEPHRAGERLAPPGPRAGGGGVAPCSFPPHVFLQADPAGHLVVMSLEPYGFSALVSQDPRSASELGLALIRAALLASKPGSVPA